MKRTRRDGPLAVFGTLTDAVRFVGCYGGGEYNNVICLCSYLESSDVTYWQNAPGHIQIQTSARGVRGKRFADAVVLLEEVWS